jgi:hypothetical protein
MSQLQYVTEMIVPRIESGEVESGEVVFDAVELWDEVKPHVAMTKLIEVFKPLAVGRRHIHIREESDTASVVIPPGTDFKRISSRPVSRYVVSWFNTPEGHKCDVQARGEQDSGEADRSV